MYRLGFEPTKESSFYFFSYNRDDSERLAGLAALLSKSIPLWYDAGIKHGTPDGWEKQIGEKIESCKGFLIFVTNNLLLKTESIAWVELEHASKKNIPIYCVVLDSVDHSSFSFCTRNKWSKIERLEYIEGFRFTSFVNLVNNIIHVTGNISTHISSAIASTPTAPVISGDGVRILREFEDSYQKNGRHIFVFNELDRARRDSRYIVRFSDNSDDTHVITQCDIIQYLTFFEGIYRAVCSNVLALHDIDDCFADRFFLFIHNRHVQENELYIVPETYANIFELYYAWKRYHISQMTDPRLISRFLEKEIPNAYIEKKSYDMVTWAVDTRNSFESQFSSVVLRKRWRLGLTFHMKRLFPKDLPEIIELQDGILSTLDDPDLFVKSTTDELLESMLIDFCYGLYDGDKLAAICIIVLNRGSERNLISELTDNEKYQDYHDYDCLTFDSIQVSASYRGYGIQKYFLKVAEAVANVVDAHCIIASVSPNNKFSMTNFMASGYTCVAEVTINKAPYDGKIRKIVLKQL